MQHRQDRQHQLGPFFGGWLWAALAVLLLSGGAWAAGPQAQEDQFHKDIAALAQHPTRVVGSAGYEAVGAYLRQQIAALGSAVELKEQRFSVMVPITRRAELTVAAAAGAAARKHAIYPFWPASVRVNSTPAQGITGKLVYVGMGRLEDIQPALLQGQIAAVESLGNWQNAVYFGARAVVVLDTRYSTVEATTRPTAHLTHYHLQSQELAIPVNLPRFYLPADAGNQELLADIRGGRLTAPVTVFADVALEPRQATNFYALVRPPQLKLLRELPPAAQWVLGRTMNFGPAGWGPSVNPGALVVSAPYESSSLVPDLAPGAGQAVSAAAGLSLLRELAAQPVGRPVMVFFSGGDSLHFRASREMMMSFGEPPSMTRGWKEQLAALEAAQAALKRDLERARQLKGDPSKLGIAADRSLLDRIARLIELDIYFNQDELFRARRIRVQDRPADLEQRIEQLEDRTRDLTAVRSGVQQRPAELGRVYLPSRDPFRVELGQRKRQVPATTAVKGAPPPEDASMLSVARGYLARAIERMELLSAEQAQRRAVLEERIGLFRWLALAVQRDPDPEPRGTNIRLVESIVGLDFSDGGRRVGPMTVGGFLRADSAGAVQDWREWLRRQGKARWMEEARGVLDLDPLDGARSRTTWLCAPMALPSEPAQMWGVPGFSLITLEDRRPLRDTPYDLMERDGQGRVVRPDVTVLLPQVRAAMGMLLAAASSPELRLSGDGKWARNLGVEGQVVSPAVGRPVPDLPRDGFLATFYYAASKRTARVVPHGYLAGLRRWEVVPCDAEGHYRFEALSRVGGVPPDMLSVAVQVFKLAADGSIVSCSDLGKQGGDVRVFVDVRTEAEPLRSLVFNCEEFTMVGLYDPRFLQDLSELTLLDQRRNADPQRFNYFVFRQMMAGFVEPGTSSYLLFRYGRVGNRLVFLNTSAPLSKGRYRGLRTGEIQAMSAPAAWAAQDFWNLDEQRIEEYRAVGVSNDLVDAMHREAKGQLQAARSAGTDGSDARQLVRSALGALANEARVYSATKNMANDVVRAAIFLLLLAIPFAFCLERLLIGTPNIYRQIFGSFVIFCVMAAALWRFHPAFRLSSSPLIIVLSFAIIFMSLVVISMVYGKFDTELKRLRSGRGTAAVTSFARASVLMSAVLLGIANMRKRRFRTALTCVTVILITFAVLCFTSASRYLDVTTLSTAQPVRHNGLLLRQRGFRPMNVAVLEHLGAVLVEPGLAQRNAAEGTGVLVPRFWNVNAADYKDNFNISVASAATTAPAAPLKPRAVQALLGLSPGESKVSEVAQVVPHFDRLEKGEQRIIYLPSNVAQALKLSVGMKVRLEGLELELAGIFDPIKFDTRVVALSGESLAPLNYQSNVADAAGQSLSNTNLEQLTLDADQTAAELANVYEHLYSNEIAIIPAELSQLLRNASLRTVALKLGPGDEVRRVSRELAKRFAVAMFAADDDGVRMVAASNLSSVSGAGQVAIPLAIAGLIIFNTMMGSIAERRREIHVYTSLGLAPMHVGALFVAEAMTYGLLGTVCGYILGQGVGTALMKLNWLGGVTLNYSGTSAMMTMGLILVIVLMSALVPARLASKIAAPSIERTWRVPLPSEDRIEAVLPFTINRTAADGVLAYLSEYFEAHQEGSIGKFSAGRVEVFAHEDSAGRAGRGLKTTIWLTPFDLGVRQHMSIVVHPSPQFEDIFEVQVILQRLSGDDGSWYRMNRTFLTELRKQFLQWRSLSPGRMLEYVQQSQRVLAGQSVDSEPAAAPSLLSL